ncbi:MAG: hypothetical protein LBO63_05185 [Oscillospiraceae bacterium]|jgi:aspartyl/glutamyl-tRNA(Asn/Gln) amidotransferase C subunit|nr:hypothetical protein [Oscillospiraceae bacterium]
MITADGLLKLASLSKLSLDGIDLDEMARDIGGVIDFANEVSTADLTGFDLTETDERSPLREDIVAPSVPVETILSNAGEAVTDGNGGFFVAPVKGAAK